MLSTDSRTAGKNCSIFFAWMLDIAVIMRGSFYSCTVRTSRRYDTGFAQRNKLTIGEEKLSRQGVCCVDDSSSIVIIIVIVFVATASADTAIANTYASSSSSSSSCRIVSYRIVSYLIL